MLTFKKIKKLVIFSIIFIIINTVFNVFFVSRKNSSSLMWGDYRKEKELDTIFIGSSYSQRTFVPDIYNKLLNKQSFNMGTPAQPLEETYLGIEEAVKNKNIKTIILGYGYAIGYKNKKIDIIFQQERDRNLNWLNKLKNQIKFIKKEENFKSIHSINYFFYWIYNKITYKELLNNLKKYLNYKIEKNTNLNTEFKYLGKGFYNTILINNYNNINGTMRSRYSEEILTPSFEILNEIIKLCDKNKVKLIVVNTPHTAYDIISFGEEYFEKLEQLKDYFNKRKIEYYDFNLIKKEIFDGKEEYYFDMEHLNLKGAEEFTKSFAKFMKLREQGENMEKYFYTPEEYLASIKNISAIDFETIQEDNYLKIISEAYTGSTVKVEYEISIYDNDKKEYKVVREYNKLSEYFIKVKKGKKYKIRVNARQIGADIPYEKYCEKEITIY